MADVFLLSVLSRVVLTPGALTPALRLLTTAIGVSFLADCVYYVAILRDPDLPDSVWTDVAWLSSYVLLAVACCHPATGSPRPPVAPAAHGRASTKLYVLAAGLTTPGLALLADGVDGDVASAVLGVGVVVLSLLVLARMGLLLRQLEAQAAELAVVARVDALTGVPNRRGWDADLAHACRTAQAQDTPLAVAMVDLDHFKAFNDAHGHPAGDALLRSCVQAWRAGLAADQVLARYGGEEFALLLPGLDPAGARAVLERLAALTPDGQTFSAGVAAWRPGEHPASAVQAADAALYRAKRAGRDRVEVAEPVATATA
jgi:diguanylate cyclase (GGDEF)-like protein